MEIGRRENDVKKPKLCLFESLSDGIVMNILILLAVSAYSPSHFIFALLTCKRFHALGMDASVLNKASWECFPLTPNKWSYSANRFLKRCADSGNLEANYTLGMIRYYCLGDREGGLYYITKAGKRSHLLALYSMSVIKLHGTPTDIISGASTCLTAATLGNLDAIREMAYLYDKGIGVGRSISEARKMLGDVNFMEKELELEGEEYAATYHDGLGLIKGPHPVNHFMVEWFKMRRNVDNGDLKVCSYSACGRVETKAGQFQKYEVCDSLPYCSHVCRFRDWDIRDKKTCRFRDEDLIDEQKLSKIIGDVARERNFMLF
ncbi:hypothetical protein ACHQM5_008037 [Ranunculus cassubicifolius]